jgi:hypothetical protein
MGLYSKGTRSKGVTKTFQKDAQSNTVQRTKHQKRDAFVAKEAFMKEAMAKHLAAATKMVIEATGGDGFGGRTGDARGTQTDGDAANAICAAPSFSPLAATAATRPKTTDAKPRPKLRATMATASGMDMPGSMRWEGKSEHAKRKGEHAKGGGTERDAQRAKRGETLDAPNEASEGAPKNAIGHLMKPLRGDEIDFTTTVDTNVKLPKYARGKQTVVKKRKKNKKRNARLKRSGE